ncbi:hypothetical protein CEXT_185171 [Caerostris extrusa]|uniref:Uncharacterized protein n=1 Tax=Caerostris extrusa TaxID=172846 RepID=A0AAV4SSR8_CAEEX|nr:hypothetical protein CEXT_185171 [Caerostris extrusa]
MQSLENIFNCSHLLMEQIPLDRVSNGNIQDSIQIHAGTSVHSLSYADEVKGSFANGANRPHPLPSNEGASIRRRKNYSFSKRVS